MFKFKSNADDYEDIPVTSFGAAMLRGMGWKDGEAIGLTNKGCDFYTLHGLLMLISF